MSDSNKKRVAFQLRSSYGYSAINNTAGSKKRLLTVIGEKEEKGEKRSQQIKTGHPTHRSANVRKRMHTERPPYDCRG